jgi:hypothetical protein
MLAEIKHHSGEFRINNIDSVNVESYSTGMGFEFDNLNDYLEAKKLIINEIDVFGPEELRVVFYDKNKMLKVTAGTTYIINVNITK